MVKNKFLWGLSRLWGLIILVILIIRVFPADSQIRNPDGHVKAISSVDFSPDGLLIASGSWDGMIKLWNVGTGQCERTLAGDWGAVYDVRFSPDSRMIAWGAEDHTVVVWDLVNNEGKYILRGHDNRVEALDFSPDSERIVSVEAGDKPVENPVKLWDLNTGELIGFFPGNNGAKTVKFSRDGSVFAVGCIDGAVKIWDVKSRDCVKTTIAHGTYVTGIDFHPDGKRMVTCSKDFWAKLWFLDRNKLRHSWKHPFGVNGIAFSPDGKTVATVCDDNLVYRWDANYGNLQKTYGGHTSNASCVAYSPDSRMIASGGYDKTIRIWDAGGDACIRCIYGTGN